MLYIAYIVTDFSENPSEKSPPKLGIISPLFFGSLRNKGLIFLKILLILLMEEILHHLGCVKPCK